MSRWKSGCRNDPATDRRSDRPRRGAALFRYQPARQLRLAVEWAGLNQIRWREALDGLALSLAHTSTAVRLEAHTGTGGAVIVALDGNRLHLLRTELGWSLTLDVDVPARVLAR